MPSQLPALSIFVQFKYCNDSPWLKASSGSPWPASPSTLSILLNYPCCTEHGPSEPSLRYMYLQAPDQAINWSPIHCKLDVVFMRPMATLRISNSPFLGGIYLNLLFNPCLSMIFSEIYNINVSSSWQFMYSTPKPDEHQDNIVVTSLMWSFEDYIKPLFKAPC